MSIKNNTIYSNSFEKVNHFQKLTQWVKQYSSFENFIKEVWLNEEKINENIHLREMLEKLFPPFESLLYSNHELILQILEAKSSGWHDNYLTIYQDILLQLKKARPVRSKKLMELLACTRIGIDTLFYTKVIKEFDDKVSILEFRLLNIIRSQYKKDINNINKWTTYIEGTIKEFIKHPSQNSINHTIYQLPLLGLLWHKERPAEFIYQCINLSFYEIDLKDSPELHQHLQLYFRNALVELCKRSAWEKLSNIKRDTSSWSGEYFIKIFSFQSMKIYTEQINRIEKSLQEEKLKPEVLNKKKNSLDELAR